MSLWSFIASVQEAERLRRENATLRGQVRSLEERLFAEIDSNRVRENELVNGFLEAIDIRARAGARANLGSTSVGAAEPQTSSGGDGPVALTEKDIDAIAKQYIEQSPYPYDDAATELLKDAIRRNPEEYAL